MNNKQLKAYIRDKFGLKVKRAGAYGYYLLHEELIDTLNTGWFLHTPKIYFSLSQIIDELNKKENE